MSKSGRIHKNQRRHVCQLILVSTIQCLHTHRLVLRYRKYLLSPAVIIAHSWALKVPAKLNLGVSQFTKFRAASCHCFASCRCCHDPFIVRSRPPFTGFTQLCTSVSTFRFHVLIDVVSTFTILCHKFPCTFSFGLCSCLRVCSPVTSPILSSSPSSCSGVWDPWSVEYQSCKLAMLL